MRYIISIILLFLLHASLLAAGDAIMADGSVLLNAQEVVKQLGATLTVDGDAVTLAYNGSTLTARIGSREATADGMAIHCPAPILAVGKERQLYLPLRLLTAWKGMATARDLTGEWDIARQTVTISAQQSMGSGFATAQQYIVLRELKSVPGSIDSANSDVTVNTLLRLYQSEQALIDQAAKLPELLWITKDGKTVWLHNLADVKMTVQHTILSPEQADSAAKLVMSDEDGNEIFFRWTGTEFVHDAPIPVLGTKNGLLLQYRAAMTWAGQRMTPITPYRREVTVNGKLISLAMPAVLFSGMLYVPAAVLEAAGLRVIPHDRVGNATEYRLLMPKTKAEVDCAFFGNLTAYSVSLDGDGTPETIYSATSSAYNEHNAAYLNKQPGQLQIWLVKQNREYWHREFQGDGEFTVQIVFRDLTGDGIPELAVRIGAPSVKAESHYFIWRWRGGKMDTLLDLLTLPTDGPLYASTTTLPATLYLILPADDDGDSTSYTCHEYRWKANHFTRIAVRRTKKEYEEGDDPLDELKVKGPVLLYAYD